MEETFKANYPRIDPYIIFAILWSDDFEVNHTRENRSSTWLKTISIVPPGKIANFNLYTYEICFESKKDSHSPINKIFNEELLKLQNVTEYSVLRKRNMYHLLSK